MFYQFTFQQSMLAIMASMIFAASVVFFIRFYLKKLKKNKLGTSHISYSVIERTKIPGMNINRWRFTFLQLGIIVALFTTLVAFNYGIHPKKAVYQESSFEMEDIQEIDMPRVPEEKPIIPQPQLRNTTSPIIENIIPDMADLVTTDEVPLEDLDLEFNSEPIPSSGNNTAPEVLPPPPPPPPIDEDKDDIKLVAEVMPRFPGCEDLPKKDRDLCAQKLLLEYVGEKLKYPKLASDNNIHGTCVISFVVNKNGKIEDVKISKDIGAGCGKEAMRVVQEMSLEKTWIPGKQRGRKVSVRFSLPVKFKLR